MRELNMREKREKMKKNERGERQFIRITLYLFKWKTLCKDSFLYFPVFGSINKNKSGENYQIGRASCRERV